MIEQHGDIISDHESVDDAFQRRIKFDTASRIHFKTMNAVTAASNLHAHDLEAQRSAAQELTSQYLKEMHELFATDDPEASHRRHLVVSGQVRLLQSKSAVNLVDAMIQTNHIDTANGGGHGKPPYATGYVKDGRSAGSIKEQVRFSLRSPIVTWEFVDKQHYQARRLVFAASEYLKDELATKPNAKPSLDYWSTQQALDEIAQPLETSSVDRLVETFSRVYLHPRSINGLLREMQTFETEGELTERAQALLKTFILQAIQTTKAVYSQYHHMNSFVKVYDALDKLGQDLPVEDRITFDLISSLVLESVLDKEAARIYWRRRYLDLSEA